MNFLLVLRGVFAHAVKPGIWVMSFFKYLTGLNRDGGCRKIRDMQVRIFFKNQGVWRRVDVVGIPIGRDWQERVLRQEFQGE